MSRSTPNKLTPTDKVILCWGLSRYYVRTMARAFDVSEKTVYDFKRSHREHDSHDPYCRGLTR